MLKRIFHVYLMISFGIAAAAYSQSPSQQALIARPILTFVLDSSHQLRPLVGIPGSASIGTPVDLGFEVTQAVIPPDHDYILAATSQSDWPVLLNVRGGTVTPMQSLVNSLRRPNPDCTHVGDPALSTGRKAICRPVSRAVDPGPIDSMALSPAGSAAAFLSQATSSVYVFFFSNLAQSPAPLQIFNIGGLGAVSSFAISDDGTSLLLGTSTGDAASVFLLTGNNQAQLIASMRHVSSVSFLHKSASAVIADDVDNAIYAWSNGQFFMLAGPNDGVSAPIGIAASNDNQRVFVANAQTGTVMTIRADGTLGKIQSCNCSLTGLYSTNTDSVFRLTDFSGGPILLFDASGASPRMTFVPVAAE
jgi:hypothetical protein